MRIFIPTKGRPWASQLTWHAIRQDGHDLLDRYDVTLVVATEEERDYFLSCKVPCIASGVQGISAARQFILDHARKCGTNKVLMLDDDLSSWAARTPDGRFVKTVHAPRQAFEWVEEQLGSFAHAGIGHRQFANNKPEVVVADRMLRALGYRTDILHAIDARFTLPLMEDFEMTLKLLTKGLANAVYYGVVQDQAQSHAAGGCTGLRTLELQDMSARALQEMFPNYVKLKQAEGWELGTRTDVSVQWKRAYHGK